jgi:hypothetical protein
MYVIVIASQRVYSVPPSNCEGEEYTLRLQHYMHMCVNMHQSVVFGTCDTQHLPVLLSYWTLAKTVLATPFKVLCHFVQGLSLTRGVNVTSSAVFGVLCHTVYNNDKRYNLKSCHSHS